MLTIKNNRKHEYLIKENPVAQLIAKFNLWTYCNNSNKCWYSDFADTLMEKYKMVVTVTPACLHNKKFVKLYSKKLNLLLNNIGDVPDVNISYNQNTIYLGLWKTTKWRPKETCSLASMFLLQSPLRVEMLLATFRLSTHIIWENISMD